jgi:hypothetical protein
MRILAALFVVACLLVVVRLVVVERIAQRKSVLRSVDTNLLPPVSRPTLVGASSLSSSWTGNHHHSDYQQQQQQQEQQQQQQHKILSSPSPSPSLPSLTWEEVCTQEAVQQLPFCALDCTSTDYNHQNHHPNKNTTTSPVQRQRRQQQQRKEQRDCWTTRVEDYVSRIPIQSILQMMGNTAASYPPLFIPPYQWWNEGLHGAKTTCATVVVVIPSSSYSYSSVSNATTTTTTTNTTTTTTTYCPTSFPCPSGLGNAFDDTLYYQVARTIAKQARALSEFHRIVERNTDNAIMRPDHNTGLTLWSPTLNLQRDPRWGRNQEGMFCYLFIGCVVS